MTVKFLALTTAAVLAAASAQAQTADTFSADLTGLFGNIALHDVEYPEYNFNDGSSQALSFRLMTSFGGNMFGQLDYGTENNIDGESDSNSRGDNSYTAQGAALHLGMVNGATTYGVMYSAGSNTYEDNTYNTLAVEAVNTTDAGALSGQIGLTRSTDGEEKATFGRIAYAMDVAPKLTLTTSLGMARWEYATDDIANLTTLGLEAAYKISDNASVLVSYQGNKGSETTGETENWNTSTVYVGVRLSLGASKPVFADYNPLYGIQHAKFTDWE